MTTFLTCAAVIESLEAYLAETTDLRLTQRIADHLEFCTACMQRVRAAGSRA